MTTILITGVGRGIGHAMAQNALRRGWTVYGSVRGKDEAERVSREFGAAFHPLVFDVTDREAMAAEIATIGEAIDIMVNNSGVIGPPADRQSTLSMDFDGFRHTLEVNTLGPLAVAQAALPLLKQSKKAAILSVSSQMSYMGYAQSDRIAYRASKAALNKVMQGLATDLKRDRITVMVVDPGWVKTDMGGEGAALDPAVVANGILNLAEKADASMTGKFFLHSGEERAY